jgi:hypothetical protein
MWRIDEERYNEKGNISLSKEEIIKALTELDTEKLHGHLKRHTKIRQRVSDSGYRWEEDGLNTTDTAYLTTIIEEELRPSFSGLEVWAIISKLLKIGIVVYAPFDIINHESEIFRKLYCWVKPIINRLDPMKLLDDDGEPDDEYSCEIGRIAGLLTVAIDLVGSELSINDLTPIVSGVFSDTWISDKDVAKCAKTLLNILGKTIDSIGSEAEQCY